MNASLSLSFCSLLCYALYAVLKARESRFQLIKKQLILVSRNKYTATVRYYLQNNYNFPKNVLINITKLKLANDFEASPTVLFIPYQL